MAQTQSTESNQAGAPKLAHPLFHVTLVEPEIPNNTGNIGRTCVALGCKLHLIHPLGFDTSEKACRRAGLDYWPRLDVEHHPNFAAYQSALLTPSPSTPRPPRVWLLTTKATRTVFEADLRRGDHLLFGKETKGLSAGHLALYPDNLIALPMMPAERSLNLATAVCAVAYEGVRQLITRNEVSIVDGKRLII